MYSHRKENTWADDMARDGNLHAFLPQRRREREKQKEANTIVLGAHPADLTNVYVLLFGHYDSLQLYIETPSWVF